MLASPPVRYEFVQLLRQVEWNALLYRMRQIWNGEMFLAVNFKGNTEMNRISECLASYVTGD
ncbi:hypothetical protein PAALTS15_22628 [Paenibacillus alvei TS-15]|uniref:Uncharacterized protein n=1 Tax=Paenibacillus alvei TS-15 TaxID=1117108 RepID=S9SFV8_PAEAL|nr:hypothetical protein PAALTS15_22628 [Paenibacillus alvei TS-15]